MEITSCNLLLPIFFLLGMVTTIIVYFVGLICGFIYRVWEDGQIWKSVSSVEKQ